MLERYHRQLVPACSTQNYFEQDIDMDISSIHAFAVSLGKILRNMCICDQVCAQKGNIISDYQRCLEVSFLRTCMVTFLHNSVHLYLHVLIVVFELFSSHRFFVVITFIAEQYAPAMPLGFSPKRSRSPERKRKRSRY